MIVMVLGNARSGTSMVCGILHTLGVNMHPIENSATVQCPKGTFEDGPIIGLIHQQRTNEITTDVFQSRYKALIEQRKSENPTTPWGFKNTVFHFEPSLYMNGLDKSEIRFVMTFRNPVDCALSLMVNYKYHHGSTPRLKQLLPNVCGSMQRLGNMLHRFPEVKKEIVTYEQTKIDPVAVTRRLAAFAELPCAKDVLTRADELILRDHSTLTTIDRTWGPR